MVIWSFRSRYKQCEQLSTKPFVIQIAAFYIYEVKHSLSRLRLFLLPDFPFVDNWPPLIFTTSAIYFFKSKATNMRHISLLAIRGDQKYTANFYPMKTTGTGNCGVPAGKNLHYLSLQFPVPVVFMG